MRAETGFHFSSSRSRELPAIRLTIGDSILEIYPYTSTFSPAFAHS